MDKNASAVVPVPAVRLASRLQFAVSFFPPSSSRRAGWTAPSPPPALMADVRVVIRRHFPAGGRVVETVAEDIALRRRPSRKLRRPEHVERALAADVLPAVEHPFDRGAVVASRREICACVAGACADGRLAAGGVQVLVLLDTFACPMLLCPRPPSKSCKKIRSTVCPTKHADAVVRTNPCTGMELPSMVPSKEPQPVGVVGDRRPKSLKEVAQVHDARLEGWVPW